MVAPVKAAVGIVHGWNRILRRLEAVDERAFGLDIYPEGGIERWIVPERRIDPGTHGQAHALQILHMIEYVIALNGKVSRILQEEGHRYLLKDRGGKKKRFFFFFEKGDFEKKTHTHGDGASKIK